jgi:hypothetical protein
MTRMTHPPSPLPTTLERLAALTTELEGQVPSLRGLLPDLEATAAQLAAAEGRRATYALGTIKSGKSTLVSALLGIDALPRGSGVKTFNITRVSHAPTPRARVSFKTAQQLAGLIRFDLRMLGCLAEAPVDPYAEGGSAILRKVFEGFEAEARADGRLTRIEGSGDEGSLLRLSLMRLRHVTQSLERIAARQGAAVLERIRTTSELVFEGDAFERYLDWANVVEHAALIQEIELSLPFPPTLSPREVLVDCQGSDSLNPLDFAAVDSALHRADRVLYVVSSRLGLRIADKSLVRHVAAGGLAAKTSFILNVEAFEPLPQGELDALLAKLREGLASLGLEGAPVRAICALHELNRRKGADDRDVVKAQWERRGAAAVLTALEGSFAELEASLGRDGEASLADGPGSEERIAALVARRIKKIAEGVLARDRDIHGVQGTELAFQEVKDAVHRIVEGERAELRKRLDRMAHEAYDAHAAVQKDVDQFLAAGADAFAKGLALPDGLKGATRHGEVMAAALERFNAEWTMLDQRIRVSHVHPLVETTLGLIRQSVMHLHKVVPGVIGSRFTDAGAEVLPGLRETMAHVDSALDQFRSQTDVPETLSPVVLVPHLASGLAAEFYARQWFSALQTKVQTKLKRAKAEPAREEPPALPADEKKIATLWQRTLKAAHKAAKQDQEFSVSSARENLKFMYLGKAIDRAYQAFEGVMLAGIGAYYEDLERLRARRGLLLSGEDRRKVEAWLAAI